MLYIIETYPALILKKGDGEMSKKLYIRYKRKQVFAIYFRSIDTIYINVDFTGETQLFMII